MPTSVNNSDNRSFFQRGTDLIIGKISPSKTISQVELISNLEPKAPITKPLTIEERREKTNAATQEFVIKSTIFAIGNFLYKWCNVGDKDTDVDRKLLSVVRDLSKCKSPGFREIRTVMNRYFKNLSFFRMAFFYCTFVSWVPKLYISTTINKLLETSRKKLNDGKNLPDLGSRVVKTANSYLANYNNAVDRFRDNETNPTGDRDKYLKEHLQHPKILGFDSVEALNSEFAKAASKDGMRPDFSPLSNMVKKIQLLEFKILRKIPKLLLLPLKAVTLTLGTIPYILAKLLEIPPNVIINIFHKRMIESFAPSILEDTLKAVNRSGFTHAINCFLSDIIEDALIEMKKGPYEKTTEEPPKNVDKALSSEIKKFSEFLFTLITREQYQTKDELKRIQKNGLVPKSGIERFLKKLRSPQYIDEWIKYFFVDKALHPNIIELFNFLCQSEKFEEYLCNLIELLNKIYEDVPDTTTPEGLALLEEHKQKQSQREELVDTLIQEGITSATEDGIHEYFGTTSKNQDNDLILACRKVKKRTLEKLPRIQQDAKNILLSCKDLLDSFSPVNSITPAKEDILLAKLDLKNLFTVIQNAVPKENGPVKIAMDHQLKDFKAKEKVLVNCLNQADSLHDEIEQLKSFSKEIKNLKSLFNSNNIDIEKIKESVNALQSLKRSLEFDKMIDEYKFLSDQFEKIQTHEKYISTLQEVLKNTFFKNDLLLELAKAQKEYLNSPRSLSKEKRLKALNEKMLRFLNSLNPIAEDSDISELKDVIRKIYICPNPQKIKTAYTNAKKLFKEKLSKHASLLEDEKVMLKTKCLEKCRSTIKKQENEFSTLFKDSHQNLMENAKMFSDGLNALKNIATDIDKRKQSGLNRKTLIQSAKAGGSALTAVAANYFAHPYLSAASLAISGISLRKLKPMKWIASRAVVPLAKDVATNAANPLAKASAESAYSVITNPGFYEGLIHAYMKEFINDTKKSKK